MKRTFRVVLAVEYEDGSPELKDNEVVASGTPDDVHARAMAEQHIGDWLDGLISEAVVRTGEPMEITIVSCEETTA